MEEGIETEKIWVEEGIETEKVWVEEGRKTSSFLVGMAVDLLLHLKRHSSPVENPWPPNTSLILYPPYYDNFLIIS